MVSYSKYPPTGTRGYGPMFAPHSYAGLEPAHYDANAHDILVIVQIESPAGVENVEKIAAVDGIDVLFIGPFDMAKQMGLERGGPEHEAAIQRVLAAAHNAGKKAAIFCESSNGKRKGNLDSLTISTGTDGKDALRRKNDGFDMISIITDVGVFKSGMVKELRIANGEAGEAGARSGY